MMNAADTYSCRFIFLPTSDLGKKMAGKNIVWSSLPMPIHAQSAAEIRQLPEDVFKEIAYGVTGAAFEVHNRYGKFFAEKT